MGCLIVIIKKSGGVMMKVAVAMDAVIYLTKTVKQIMRLLK